MAKKNNKYEHIKGNVIKSLGYFYGVEKVIELVKADNIEDAIKEYDRIEKCPHFALSAPMARMLTENMRNNLIQLANLKRK